MNMTIERAATILGELSLTGGATTKSDLVALREAAIHLRRYAFMIASGGRVTRGMLNDGPYVFRDWTGCIVARNMDPGLAIDEAERLHKEATNVPE